MTLKLSVCMISSEFPPDCAGIGYNVYALSRGLARRGHRVTILTRGSWFDTCARWVDGIEVYELPFIPFPPPFHLVYHGFFVNRLLKVIEADFDLLHLHTPLVPRVDSTLTKVVSVQSLWLEESKYFNNPIEPYSLAVKVFQQPVLAAERTTLGQADRLIVYSEEERELLEKSAVDLPAVHVIGGIIQSKFFQSQDVEKNNGIVFVGRLNSRKGIIDLVEAAPSIAENCPEARFTIVGTGPLRGTLRRKVARYGLEDKFTFLGYVPNDRLPSILSESSISVVPSLYEPFGIVTGEAMACGLPVVGTNVGGTKRMVVHDATGLLVPMACPSAISEAVVRLLKNQDLRDRLGKAGKERIAKHFSNEAIVRKVEDVYRRALADPRDRVRREPRKVPA